MALTFPLALASFVDLLPIASCSFDLGEAMQVDETGGGEQLMSDLGARLWTGRYAMGPMTFDEATAAQALIDVIRASGRSFLATDLRQRGPRADPTGAGLTGYTPVISSVSSGDREIGITGAPPGYTLGRGDMLAFAYGTGTTRRALHRVVTGGTVNGLGDLPSIEVVPALRSGLPVLPPLTFFRPACKAVILPGSFEPGDWRDRLVSGMSFRFVQTLAV